MSVKLVKLISGEELFCEVEHVSEAAENLIRMKHPCVLMPVQTESGQQGLTFAAWLPFADTVMVEIRAAHALLVTDVTNQNLINAYFAKTGGIVTAQPHQVPKLALPSQ